MKLPKINLSASLALLFLFVSFLGVNTAYATKIHTYEGELVGSVDGWVADPGTISFNGFELGDRVYTTYSYESETIDGTFSLADGTLGVRGFFNEDLIDGRSPEATLVIEGGSIKSFLYLSIRKYAEIRSSDGNWDFDGILGGALTATDPKRVPDTGSTALLLGVGFLSLVSIRRRMGRS